MSESDVFTSVCIIRNKLFDSKPLFRGNRKLDFTTDLKS